MVSATTALVASAIVSTAATGYSMYAQNEAQDKAQASQERANRVSAASAQVRSARERRRAIAQARIAQAQNAANMGSQVQSSSAEAGVSSSLASQLGANLGAQTQGINSQLNIQSLNQSAANALQTGRERSSLAQGIGSILSTGLQTYAMTRPDSTGPAGSTNTSTQGSQRQGYSGADFQNWLNR